MCDLIILQIFALEHFKHHAIQCTQQVQECVQIFKSLALLKVKIEPFKLTYSPILNPSICPGSKWNTPTLNEWFFFEIFELQKAQSQVFGALTHIRSIRTTQQTPLFQKNNFCDDKTSLY